MPNHVHFEVFRRVGARGGWTLHEVVPSRDAAITLAQTLMGEEKATGVKVVKETYNEETGDYLTLKIFEDGHNQMKASPAQEEAAGTLPCFKPDDLYSYHARATMRRLLGEFLSRNRLTVTELIHRADMLEKLEATGTLCQHAIQKIAVAQAASTNTPVQQIIKSLNDLTTQAFNRVYRDQRRGLFPDPRPDQFAELARQVCGQGDAHYVFNGALARHLRDARGWDDKVLMLIAVMEQAPADEAPRRLVLSSVDAILAEVLAGSAALHDLMGPSENLAQALNRLVALFLGKAPEDAKEGLTALTQHFAADDLPEARTAIAHRLVAEFKSNKRLCPDSLVEELKALRQIANRVVMGVGKYLSHEDLVAAFTLRSSRLVMQETLGPYIVEAPPEEKIERLLFVEDNIIGGENKRQLAAFVAPILDSAAFENHFNSPATPLPVRLQRLAQLQTRVRRSGFIDVTRDEIARRMDEIAGAVAGRGRLFETIEARPARADRAQALLKLLTRGVLTEGLASRARAMVLALVAQPGFLADYAAALAGDGEMPDSEKARAALIEMLAKAGITAETGLKPIAA
jgi:hypothetical protein